MRSLRLQIDERYGLGRQPQRQANPIRQVILPARLRYRPSWSLRLSEPSRIVAVSLSRFRRLPQRPLSSCATALGADGLESAAPSQLPTDDLADHSNTHQTYPPPPRPARAYPGAREEESLKCNSSERISTPRKFAAAAHVIRLRSLRHRNAPAEQRRKKTAINQSACGHSRLT